MDGCICTIPAMPGLLPLDSVPYVIAVAGLRMSRVLHSFVVAIPAPCSGLAHMCFAPFRSASLHLPIATPSFASYASTT